MLHLYKSNRLEWLAEKLSKSLHFSGNMHPLQSDTIIVPNRDNARWLQFKIAEQNVISANIQYLLPAEWMWNEIRRLHPDTPKELATDKNPLKWAILNLLMNGDIPENAKLIENYISNSAKGNRVERYIQLSDLIASVYDKYMVHRPDMILEWDKGNEVSGNRHEVWQMNLWNRLIKIWDSYYSSKLQYHSPVLWNDILQKILNGKVRTDPARNLWVFHSGKLPEPLVEILVAYSAQIPVHMFNHQLLDLKTIVHKKNDFLIDMLDEEISAEKSLQFFISEYKADFEQNTHYEKRSGSSFLHLIQNRLLTTDKNQSGRSSAPPDQTVSIHSCHSKLREIETLHNYILNCIEISDTVYPDDILVVSPDMDKYTSYIRAVFGTKDRDLPKIPFTIGEKNISNKNSIYILLEQILEFTESRWFPSNFMDILHSGPIMEKFNLSEADISLIRRWITDNHITWGMDSDHRKIEEQPENRTNTYRSALNSLWLGHLFDLPDFVMIDDIPAYQGIDTTEKEDILSRFSSCINLLNEIRIDSTEDRTLDDWREKGIYWIESLFPVNSSEYRLHDIIEFMRSLLEQSRLSGFKEKVPYRVFKKEILSAIKESRSTTASLATGVVFSSMVPMRNIPFKIVALIGLNEEEFPRKISAPEFDLIQNSPTSRETTVKDEDRHLFLQYVMAPTEKLFISYVGRSIVDNEKIQPSVILEKWIDRIEHITGVNMYNLIEEESLNGFSENQFKCNKSYSNIYAEVAESLNTDDKKSGNYSATAESIEIFGEVIRIKDLESFFRNPVKFYLKDNFGVWLSDFDDRLGEEIFVPDALLSYKLTGTVLGWMETETGKEPSKNLLIKSGMVPDDFLGHQETDRIIEQDQKILKIISEETGSYKKNQINISYQLNSSTIEGYVKSYSTNKYYDIFLSSKSGKNLIVAWLRYLHILNHFKKNFVENRILLNAKKDGGEWFSFSPVDDPVETLENLAEIYLKGIQRPFLFAPKTSFSFSKSNYEETFEKAIQRGESEWFGNFVIAENSDPVYQLWFGRTNPLELPEFRENSDRVFKDLIKNLE